MKLWLYREGVYYDQFDIEHQCYIVEEEIEIERTEQVIAWKYYDTVLQDRLYRDVNSEAMFRCHIPTDFGCGPTWSFHSGSPARTEEFTKDGCPRFVLAPDDDRRRFICNRPVIKQEEL